MSASDSPSMLDGRRTRLRSLFSARLKALRLEKGWTATQTAARAGCTVGYYCKLERGDQEPAFEMLAKLARAFGLDEIDLLTFPGATERHDLCDLLRRASESVRLRVLEFLREELARDLRSNPIGQE